MSRTAFVYSERMGSYSYGADHPMRPVRLGLAHGLMKRTGLLAAPGVRTMEARPATHDELLLFHAAPYIEALKKADSGAIPRDGPRFGLGLGDNPAWPGVFEWSSYSAGASLRAAELVANGETDIAFNMAGGLHHAMADRASGFCYINDAVLAIKYLTRLGRRVAYVDIDAHHGDGVERAFYDTSRVLTVSLHESGRWLFPGTGFPEDMGSGDGMGFSVNLPFLPGTRDDIFLKGFSDVVPSFIEAFRPDVLVTQLGVDSLAGDPLTHLELTTRGFEDMVKAFKGFGVPWVALGGGGYDLANVARAWTLAWAVMNDVRLPDELPEPVNLDGMEVKGLRAKGYSTGGPDYPEEDVSFLRQRVLPFIKARRGPIP